MTRTDLTTRKCYLPRRTMAIIAAIVLPFVETRVALSQDLMDTGGVSGINELICCNQSGCDRMFDNVCRANRAKQTGTVGTLFRWSFDPAGGDVAQLDEPLISDRPDFTESSSVVGLGVLQFETGYTYTYDNDGTSRTIGHSYPESLVLVYRAISGSGSARGVGLVSC